MDEAPTLLASSIELQLNPHSDPAISDTEDIFYESASEYFDSIHMMEEVEPGISFSRLRRRAE
jgi:hypothetical protein